MSNTITALRLTVDGELTAIDLEQTAGAGCLQALYREIECQGVDVVRLADNIDMWLDDEGLYTADVNPIATAIAKAHGFVWQKYVGNVVFTGGADDEGDTLPLSPAARERIEALVADYRA
ncbi:DUF3846 domain-containing protein [Rhodococcus hoagii]|nr:DUF3846 domain-containing protein [Prescottella equi]NKS71672.1 DUF3846 domain-containing protein [Prescottella equi]